MFAELLKTVADRLDGASAVQVSGHVAFAALVNDTVAAISRGHAQESRVLMDHETARALEDSRRLFERGVQVTVYGGPDQPWTQATYQTLPPALSEQDRFCIVLSPELNAALIAGTDRQHGFEAWAVLDPDQVRAVARKLLGSQVTRGLPPVDMEAVKSCLSYSTALASMLMRYATCEADGLAVDKHDLLSVLDILKAISSRRRSHDVLFVFVEKIARIIETARCSVVRVWGDETIAHVLASHDDERINDLKLDLAKYPEIQHSLETLGKVVIDDVAQDELTQPFVEDLRRARISSLIVVPIMLLDPHVGSLFLRAARDSRPFTHREVSFCEIVAEAASNALERAHLFESIQKANKRLEFLAVTDGLTGLFNHRHFRERLDEEFERARRYKLPLSCLIFDIDDFKKINDTFGHLQGDQILQEIASRTLNLIRRSDLAARYGGEEFTIVMPQTGLEGAKAQGQRMLDELSRLPYKGVPEDYPVTVSVGVAVLDHENMLDCEALVRCADTALYQAKRNGKNQVVIGKLDERSES